MLQTHVFGVVIPPGVLTFHPFAKLLGVLQQLFPLSHQSCHILGHPPRYSLLGLCFPAVLVRGSCSELSVSWSLCEVPQQVACCQQGC